MGLQTDLTDCSLWPVIRQVKVSGPDWRRGQNIGLYWSLGQNISLIQSRGQNVGPGRSQCQIIGLCRSGGQNTGLIRSGGQDFGFGFDRVARVRSPELGLVLAKRTSGNTAWLSNSFFEELTHTRLALISFLRVSAAAFVVAVDRVPAHTRAISGGAVMATVRRADAAALRPARGVVPPLSLQERTQVHEAYRPTDSAAETYAGHVRPASR